ncbi:MAG: A/G-specific adenine glycosylase [Saprospiraceae bacterium]
MIYQQQPKHEQGQDKMDATKIEVFRQRLMHWYANSHRPMPWKGEKNPYLIWLSEIILQQTRVEQGLPYFEKFKQAYPTVQHLADAPEDEVMKLWEGLGYYSRARNMHATAKFIATDLKGLFPDTYEGILALKGVGPYTAAAIASFAYDLPHAVVDGNVFRVLSRFFGIATPTDSTAGKKLFNDLAQQTLDTTQPGRYNQAIMDFGATQCTPQLPNCVQCPLQADCVAFQQKMVDKLPVKTKSIVKKDRFFYYLVLQYGEETLLQKRTAKDIWQNLYEFPMLELPAFSTDLDTVQQSAIWQQLIGNEIYTIKKISKPYRQILTHQVVNAIFLEIELQAALPALEGDLIAVERKNWHKFAFPKIIDCYFQDKSLYLNLL